MDKLEFLALIDKYLEGTATLQEEQLLLNYIGSFQQQQQWSDELLGDRSVFEAHLLNRIRSTIRKPEEEGFLNGAIVAHRVHFLKTSWFRYAAAVLAIIAGIGLYTYLHHPEKQPDSMAVISNDVLPGGNKATLTLANGTTIMLDSAADGSLAEQGNTKIIKLNAGSLAYHKGLQQVGGEVLYNTIRTPRGGQYQVILEDGSKIWLNAESAVKFPATFSGKDRIVSITGEAYLEVAKDITRPFSVQTEGGHTVDVLGTSFNINAYDDEAFISTTLIDGSVRIRGGRNAIVLKPGQQSQVNDTGVINRVAHANIAQAIAWKQGFFSFTDADVPAVMRQLSRWYNVEVVYAAKIPQRAFNGEIGRSLTLIQVMKLLSKTGVNYKIENGNKIIIYP